MTLTFLNNNRFYDPDRRQIRFVGHDGMATVSFRVEIDAIMNGARGEPQEEGAYLRSFDSKRDTILSAALEAYSGKRQSVYILTQENFGKSG